MPGRSRLATALNGGRPRLNPTTDRLLADLWVVTVRANTPKDSLPEGFDHPLRAEETVRVKVARMRELKAIYEKRKAARRIVKHVAEVKH